MTPTPEYLLVPTIDEQWRTDPLRLAVAGYLPDTAARPAATPNPTRAYLTWCDERGLDPLTARRPHVELDVRWMQETEACALTSAISAKNTATASCGSWARATRSS